jgi:hypothetical protein
VVIGGRVGGMIILIIVMMYFIHSRDTEATNVIAQERAAIYEIEVGVNYSDVYQEPIGSAPPPSSPLCNAIDKSMANGQQVPLSFEGKSTLSPVALAAYKRAISESVKAAPVCMIRMENPKVIALLPCGHKAYCAECFVDPILSQGNRPYCRTAVTGTIRLYD